MNLLDLPIKRLSSKGVRVCCHPISHSRDNLTHPPTHPSISSVQEYRIGKPPKVFLRLIRNLLLVRVGGGWEGIIK